jgi:hypothetical protein
MGSSFMQNHFKMNKLTNVETATQIVCHYQIEKDAQEIMTTKMIIIKIIT